MIGRLHGILADKNPPQILVDAGGVGYEVDVPMSTFCVLPDKGSQVTVWTHMVVREDALLLYGFATLKERSMFRELIKVSGIGPRTALAILSGMSVEDLAGAVTRQETAMLIRVPGIGKRTAERLIVELKGKIGADLAGPAVPASDTRTDVIQALVALGYSEKDAATAARQVPADASVSDGIRMALQSFTKKK